MSVIIHATTVHPRTDVRIRVKEVATLSQELDQEVSLFVQDGLGNELDADHGFLICDTGASPKGRLKRAFTGGYRMYRAVRRAKPKIVHIHDPELVPWALLLRLSGIKIIYDAHEDLPRQIAHKPYLPVWVKAVLAKVLPLAERMISPAFAATIVVVPEMLKGRPQKNTVMVANYPKLSEFMDLGDHSSISSYRQIVYVGGLSRARGVREMVEAVSRARAPDAELVLLGRFESPEIAAEIEELPGWASTKFLGWCDRATVVDALSQARAGCVVLHPTPQYVLSFPVKMFEYMAAGLPLIASDFPLWREIIDQAGCGLLVDPHDAQAIADAMDWILTNPCEAQAMGQRGRRAVESTYNWSPEGRKLVALYRELLQGS